jgi:hypothetical protein
MKQGNSTFLDFSPSQLKDLEKYMVAHAPEERDTGLWINSYSKRTWPPDFLKIINYDINKLFKLYSYNLKRIKDPSMIHKYLKLKSTPLESEVINCIKVFRVLQMPLDILPLKMNKFTGVSKSVIYWRFINGL